MAFSVDGLRAILKKYGKVAVGFHVSVSAVSITGFYIAIMNNVDVESLLQKVGIGGVSAKGEKQQQVQTPLTESIDRLVTEEPPPTMVKKNGAEELTAMSGGAALALAILCNKALFPIRLPITIAVVPPLSRFLARRRIIKNNVEY